MDRIIMQSRDAYRGECSRIVITPTPLKKKKNHMLPLPWTAGIDIVSGAPVAAYNIIYPSKTRCMSVCVCIILLYACYSLCRLRGVVTRAHHYHRRLHCPDPWSRCTRVVGCIPICTNVPKQPFIMRRKFTLPGGLTVSRYSCIYICAHNIIYI
jgi:hypothetical protein